MGEFFALLTAVFWAGAVILFKRSGETLPPLALNGFRVTVSAALLLATMLALGQAPWRTAPAGDLLLIALSGTLGIAVADTLFHASLNRVGAGITAVIDCLYPTMTTMAAYWLLGERLSVGDLAGLALVVAAVLVATTLRPPAGLARRDMVVGILLGAAGMAALSLGIVVVKPVLRDQPLIWVTGMRQLAALAVLAPALALSKQRRALARVATLPRDVVRFALPGTVLGSYLSLIAWIAGMKYTTAGAAAILNQTSTIYIIVLARIFLAEPFTKRRVLACALAVAGVACVVLG